MTRATAPAGPRERAPAVTSSSPAAIPLRMYFFLQIALSGLANGAIYGIIAVGYSITFILPRRSTLRLGCG